MVLFNIEQLELAGWWRLSLCGVCVCVYHLQPRNRYEQKKNPIFFAQIFIHSFITYFIHRSPRTHTHTRKIHRTFYRYTAFYAMRQQTQTRHRYFQHFFFVRHVRCTHTHTHPTCRYFVIAFSISVKVSKHDD